MLVVCPSRWTFPVFTMISPNCSGSVSWPQRGDGRLEIWPSGAGGWPSCPAGDGLILSRIAYDDIVGGSDSARQLIGIEPGADAVIAFAGHGDVADAGQAGEFVDDVNGGVVAQVNLVETRSWSPSC